MKRIISISLAAVAAFGIYALAQTPKGKVMETTKEKPKELTKEEIAKMTDEEWKKKLTPEQYHILRKAGTERSNGKVYKEFKAQGAGTYYCAGCNAELFSSKTKFDSQCGWPSFYDPAKAKNVKTSIDFHLGYARTEVLCKVCDGHLGHVFEGESFAAFNGKTTPTKQRYCINGTVLKFVPDNPGKEEGKKEETKKEEKIESEVEEKKGDKKGKK